MTQQYEQKNTQTHRVSAREQNSEQAPPCLPAGSKLRGFDTLALASLRAIGGDIHLKKEAGNATINFQECMGLMFYGGRAFLGTGPPRAAAAGGSIITMIIIILE